MLGPRRVASKAETEEPVSGAGTITPARVPGVAIASGDELQLAASANGEEQPVLDSTAGDLRPAIPELGSAVTTPQVELAPDVDSSALAEAMGNFASEGSTPATEALREIGEGVLAPKAEDQEEDVGTRADTRESPVSAAGEAVEEPEDEVVAASGSTVLDIYLAEDSAAQLRQFQVGAH